MKITIQSKPEEVKSSKGTTYWKVKILDENLEQRSGSFFGDVAPEIDKDYEVEEKFNEQYKSYSWFLKREKKGFTPKPGLTIDQQIRVAALNAAVTMAAGKSSTDVTKVAHYFETYIKNGI